MSRDMTGVVVVDDEPLACERVGELVSNLPGYRLLGTARGGREAMALIELKRPDVVLLDISMPGMDGMDLARYLRGMDHAPAVIFCTAHDQYALDAFDTGASGYLLKPVREGRLLEALESARRVNRMQLKTVSGSSAGGEGDFCFHIESHRGVELIPLHQVTHLVADQKYVTVFHEAGESLMETSLKAILEQYPDFFIRVHRDTLVSIDRVAGIRRLTSGESQVRLLGTEQEPHVSRRHLRDLKLLLAERARVVP